MLFKKGDAGLTVAVIIIIVVFLGWLVNVGQRECDNNNDCRENQYCGSDFSCHNIPVIEKDNTIVQKNYLVPSIIIGASIVIAAIFFNLDKIQTKGKESYKGYPPYYKPYAEALNNKDTKTKELK